MATFESRTDIIKPCLQTFFTINASNIDIFKQTNFTHKLGKESYCCCCVKLMEDDSFKAVPHSALQQITWECSLLLICQGFALLLIKLVTKSIIRQNSKETGVHGQLGRDALSFCFCWGLLLANKMLS